MVRISDARMMGGTSFGTRVLHAAPLRFRVWADEGRGFDVPAHGAPTPEPGMH
jgi:hypothetical protein